MSRFLSKAALRLKPSAIRSLSPLAKLPGMISFAAGNPNPETFPIDSMSFQLKTGEKIHISEILTKDSMQYTSTPGLPQFAHLVARHHQRYFQPKLPADNYSQVITTGSQDALSKTFQILLDEDSSILLENPTYSGALAALRIYDPEIIAIPTDSKGIIPEKLEFELQKRRKQGQKMPKCLYTIPHCSNPSGTSIPDERKRQVLDIANRYDFLILEDDPYYFLNLDEHVSSYMKFDGEGRVLRFDSLSKILSSGLRLGWCTGPKEIVEKINYLMQATELHASSLSQVTALSILDAWGDAKFDDHVEKTKALYRERRDFFCSLAKRYLKDEHVKFDIPNGGMFVWMKINGISDSKELIEKKAREKLVLFVPGEAFCPLGEKSQYVRASYSTETKENMEIGLKRFALLLQ